MNQAADHHLRRVCRLTAPILTFTTDEAWAFAVANTEYGVTLDHVRLEGQRDYGLVNARNSISAAHLTVTAPGIAVANTAQDGLIVLTDSELRRTGGGMLVHPS